MLNLSIVQRVTLAAILAVLVIPNGSKADLIVKPPGNVSVAEDNQTFLLTVAVTNNNNFRVILDFALATITPGNPDLSDTAFFTGVNGSTGLVNAPTTLDAGATGNFVYRLRTDPRDGDNDYGLNTFSFSIEMREVANNVFVPGPLPAAQGILFYNNTPGDQTLDGNVLNQLLNYQVPANPLYAGGQFGQPYPATSLIQVFDVGAPGPPLFALAPPVPEPASLISCGLGGIILVSYRHFRRRRRTISA